MNEIHEIDVKKPLLPTLFSKVANIKRLVSNKHHGEVVLGFKGIKDKNSLYLRDFFDLVMQQPSYLIGIAFICTLAVTWSTERDGQPNLNKSV